MTKKEKQAAVRRMSTEALKRIVDNPLGPEGAKPSADKPLAGLVHLSGIGQVPLTALRDELKRREREES